MTLSLLPPLPHLVLLVFALLLVWAAASDLTRYVIPNRLCVALALLYPAHAMLDPGADWPGAILVAGAVFAAGTGLFAAGLMGGGDVKLMAATALWAGPGLALPFLFVTAATGGLLALLMVSPLGVLMPHAPTALFRNGVRPRRSKQSMPYGIAIAASGLFVAADLLIR
jgi:prepilin peptidase CpaA